MTVIVTPCILLIDNNWHYPENLQHAGEMDIEGRKWSLEDEYEYRRRRFYYRCAGAECSNSSDFENEDEEQKNNSISNYPLVSKKYWAAEKRQWLNRLAKYRAAALDKWIRTAADAKQAVGDVYGYRALMSALCSDRVTIHKLMTLFILVLRYNFFYCFIDSVITRCLDYTSSSLHLNGG